MIITYVNFKLNTLKLFPIYFVLKNNDAIIIFSGDKSIFYVSIMKVCLINDSLGNIKFALCWYNLNKKTQRYKRTAFNNIINLSPLSHQVFIRCCKL